MILDLLLLCPIDKCITLMHFEFQFLFRLELYANNVCGYRTEELPRWPGLFRRRRSPTCELGMFCILNSFI